MSKLELQYTRLVRSKGKTYWYYRRDGIQQRIEGEPGSIEFLENYQRIHTSFELGPKIPGVIPGSVEALVRTYYKSPDFSKRSDRTKIEYRAFIEPFREKVGHKPVRTFTRRDFLAVRDSLQATPAKADRAIKVLRLLFNFAFDREWITTNPVSKIKKLANSDGWEAWPASAIAKAHELLTGSARTAFMLAHYTGQRKGDVLAMQWNAIEGDGIHVKQHKTGKKVWVPLHPRLAEELSKLERKGLAIVGRRNGAPYTIDGFNSIWARQTKKYGFKRLQFHGLRRNAVNALLEAGCSVPETASITGQSFEMVSHYAQEVNQKHLAKTAMNKWQTASGKPSGKLLTIGKTENG